MKKGQRINLAIATIERHGGYDGGFHKQWVLDQVMRVLLQEDYEKWVKAYCDGEDGPHTYSWEEGIPP